MQGMHPKNGDLGCQEKESAATCSTDSSMDLSEMNHRPTSLHESQTHIPSFRKVKVNHHQVGQAINNGHENAEPYRNSQASSTEAWPRTQHQNNEASGPVARMDLLGVFFDDILDPLRSRHPVT